MKIGYMGLGKLGLPCALATEAIGGHQVYGYDPNPAVQTYLADRKIPYLERRAGDFLKNHSISYVQSPSDLVAHSDIIFVPVQTPHDKQFEGHLPMPEGDRKDFDYSFLKAAVKTLADEAGAKCKYVVVVIISTVLPGTVEREIKPLLNEYVSLCYNPYFIAMGTTIDDYLHPEFVLLGSDNDPEAACLVEKFYSTIHDKPVFKTNIESAELIKVSYNTYISMKIGFANTVMEICHKTNADADDVAKALSMANERIISPKYLKGGMGDGGGCHPRDNIAMSFLADKLNLSYNIFESLMIGREQQAKWLAELALEHADGRPVVLLGEAYKPETNLTVGSPALLVGHYVKEAGQEVTVLDPHVHGTQEVSEASVCVVTTNHEVWPTLTYPAGSVIIDPWGYMPDQEDVEVIRVGRK